MFPLDLMKMAKTNLLYILSILFVGVLVSAAPDQVFSSSEQVAVGEGDSCSIFCTDASSQPLLLKYKEKEPYRYKVEGSNFLHTPSSLKGEGTQLNYVAAVDLVAENKCSFTLRVSNIEIVGPGGTKKSSPTLTLYPIRFSWSNGKLGKLCVDKRETESDANFKRSLISNLQIAGLGAAEGNSRYETDVYGNCPVSLESNQEQDGSLTIKKSKNLNQCSHRQGFDFTIKTTFLQSDNNPGTNPFVDPTLNSVIRIEKDIIKSIQTNEEYNYQPLSDYADSQTRVTVSTKISLMNRSKSRPQAADTSNLESRSLLFEPVKTKEGKLNVATIMKSIQEASKEVDGVVPETAATDFGRLIQVLQQSKKQDILTTYAQVKSGAGVQNKNRAMTVFWDALTSAASPSTVETAALLLENNEMPEDKIPEFLASLSFIKHPTDETLAAVSSLLDGRTVSTDRYLAVGSVIQKFVQDNPNKTTPNLSSLLEKLSRPILSSSKTKSIEEQDMVISSLKGIRNAQFMTPEVTDAVTQYARNTQNPARLRVAALQTLIVNSSNPKVVQTAEQILTNQDEDSEVRIQAFLLLINTPTPRIAQIVKNVLDAEKSEQVGSYMTSYIRNLRNTSNPAKLSQNQYLGNIKTKSRFPFDFRQYSHNYEFTHSCPRLKMAFSGEGDLIFSRQSYVPRSASLNLDVSLFGNTLNLFELGGRFENIEYLLNDVIGPRSYLRTTTAENIADDLSTSTRNFINQMSQKASTMTRSKRSLTKSGSEKGPTMQTRSTRSTKQKETPQAAPPKYLDIDLSLKMFESEILWSAYHLSPENMATTQYMDSLFAKISEAIENAKNGVNIDYQKYSRAPLVSNNVIYYPTSSGYPIKLSTNAVSIVNFKMSTSMDLLKMLRKGSNNEFNFSILPSALIQVDGLLEIDASVMSVGLKATSSVRTATGMNIGLTMYEDRGFDLKFALPVREQDILTMETRAFSTVQDQGQPLVETPLKPAGQRYESMKKYDQVARIAGISLSTEVSTPDYVHSPILGPSKFSIRLKKEDENLKFYEAKLVYNNKDENLRTFEFLLDTPGSSVNRQVAVNMEANKARNKYLLRYVGWGKQLAAEAIGVNKKNEIGFDVKLTNDNSVYNMKVGATVAEDPEKTVYKPFVDVKTPTDVRDVSLDRVRVTPKSPNQFLNVDGTVTLRKQADRPNYRNYEFQQLSLASPLGRYVLDGSFILDQDKPQFKTDVKATFGNSKYIVLQTGFENNTNGDNTDTNAHLAFVSSQWPLYGFKFTYQTNQKPNMLQRDMTFTHGPDINSDIMKLTTNEKYAWITKPRSKEWESARATIKAKYPLLKMDGALDLQQRGNTLYRAQAKVAMDKTNLRFNGSVGIGNDKPGNINAQFESQLNDRRLTVNGVRELINEDQSLVTVDAIATPGKQISAKIDVTHRIKPQDVVLKVVPKITVLPTNLYYEYQLGYVNTPDEKSVHVAAYPQKERSLEAKTGYVLTPSGLNADAVLFLKDNVDATMKLQKDSTKVRGDLKVDMKKMDRSILGTVDLSIKESQKFQNYRGIIEVQWDAKKKPEKKLKIETNTSVANDNINIKTKNNIQFEDLNLETTGNLQIADGDLDIKKVKADFSVNQQNGPSFGGKVERSSKFHEAGLDYDLDLAGYYSSNKNASPMSANYSLRAKNINTLTTTYDLTSNMSLALDKDRNAKLNIHAVRSVDNKYWTTSTDFAASGTLLDNKTAGLMIELGYPEIYDDVNATAQNIPLANVRITSNYGDDYILNTTGKVTRSTLEADVQGKVLVNQASFPFQWKSATKYDFKPSQSIAVRSIHNASWGENKFANWSGELSVQPQNGRLRMGGESSEVSKRSIDLVYVYGSEKADGLQGPFADVKFNLKMGKDTTRGQVQTEFSKDLSNRLIAINGNTPKNGDFEIRATNKVENGGQNWFQDFMLLANKNKWYISNQINTNPSKPAFDLLYASPEGESKFMIQFEERTSNYWIGETDVQWQHGGQGYIKAKTEVKLDSADDIMVKLRFDAPTLGQKNVSMSASTKSAENGSKKLTFGMQSENGSRYAGVLPYTYKNENGKLQLQGAGVIKVDNRSIPVAFKFDRQLLTDKQNGESGNLNTFYVNIDKKKYVLDMEAKFTDKVLLLRRDLYDGDTVYKMDLLYQIKMTDNHNYEKTFLAHIDLKPHIANGESFLIDGKTTRSTSNYDNRVTLSWSPEKKIEYNMYRTPGKTGFSLTLPQRQIAGEALYNYKLDTTNGLVKLSGTIWFDKTRDENDKAMIILGTEYKLPETETGVALRSTAGIRLPTLPKDLTISTGLLLSPLSERMVEFATKLDIFKQKEQAVNISYQIYRDNKDNGIGFTDKIKVTSAGQDWNTELVRQTLICLDHIKYHFALSYQDQQGKVRNTSTDIEIRLNSISANVKLMDNITLNGTTEFTITKNYLQMANDVNIMGHGYRAVTRVTTDPKIMLLLEWKGLVRQAAQVNVTLVLEKFIKVQAQLLTRGPIATFTLFLDDDKFMKSETELFIDNADILLDNAVKDINALIEDYKVVSQSVIEDVNSQLAYRRKQIENANIDMKPVMNSASQYLASLREELKKDLADSPNVQKLISNIADFVLVSVQQLTTFFTEWIDDYNKIMSQFGVYWDNFMQQIKTMMQGSVNDSSKWARDLTKNANKYGKQLLAYVKANKGQWSAAITSIGEIAKDVYHVAFGAYEQFTEDAKEFIVKATEILQSMPITNFVRERLDGMKNSDAVKWIWSVIQETAGNVRESLPTPELKTLWDMIIEFVDKVVSNKPYDTNTELKNISLQTVKGVRSLLTGDVIHFNLPDVSDSLPQLSFSSLRSVTGMYGSTLDTLNKIRKLEFNEIGEMLETYNIASMNPINLVPPFKKIGVIVNGNQIVTMNGNYLQVADDCRYTLAEDYENKAFTITANIEKGKLASITVFSNSQTIDVLPETQQPKFNNADTDYPIYGNGIYAIRTSYTVEVYIDNSAHVECTAQLDICLVHVSGFLYNNVHGLLGNVNADSYTDFTMPDNKIAQDLPTFIKAYQTNECKVSTRSTTDNGNPSQECAQMFNGNSVLKRGFSFIKTQPFRDMCEQAVAQQTKSQAKMEAACKVAQTFSMLSHAYGYFLVLPPQCSKCYLEKSPLPFGNTISVKSPTKYAEIVVILDKTKSNERIYNEPVMNTFRSLRNGLKNKGISDIRFTLIGYGPVDVTPSIHTTNGKPYLSNRTKVVFSEPTNDTPSSELGKAVRDVKYLLGMYDSRQALEMANEFPYRPDSVKAIIQVKATNDDNTSLDQLNVYNTLVNAVASWNIINNKIPMFLVAPMDLLLGSAKGDQNLAFGVDATNIYTADGPKPFESGYLDQMKFLQQYKASVLLPLSTQGAVFNSTAFSEKDANVRSKLSNVFADAVTYSLVSNERYSDCTCKYKLGVYSEVRCSLASLEKAS